MAVVTDLDGTFIDFGSYGWAATQPVAQALLEAGVCVAFCSSKTRSEQRALMEETGLEVPGIVENGAGIYLPPGVSLFAGDAGCRALPEGGRLLELGRPAAFVREAARRVSAEMGLDLEGYSGLALEELARRTGLSLAGAERGRQRDFSETFTAGFSPEVWRELEERFWALGVKCQHGGRFRTAASADCDKGRALGRLMAELRRSSPGEWVSVAIGDSANDFDMLAAADEAYLVQGQSGRWAEMELPGLWRVAGVGPEGWKLAVAGLLPGG